MHKFMDSSPSCLASFTQRNLLLAPAPSNLRPTPVKEWRNLISTRLVVLVRVKIHHHIGDESIIVKLVSEIYN